MSSSGAGGGVVSILGRGLILNNRRTSFGNLDMRKTEIFGCDNFTKVLAVSAIVRADFHYRPDFSINARFDILPENPISPLCRYLSDME